MLIPQDVEGTVPPTPLPTKVGDIVFVTNPYAARKQGEPYLLARPGKNSNGPAALRATLATPDLFTMPHGLAIGPDGHLYLLVDPFARCVRKCSTGERYCRCGDARPQLRQHSAAAPVTGSAMRPTVAPISTQSTTVSKGLSLLVWPGPNNLGRLEQLRAPAQNVVLVPMVKLSFTKNRIESQVAQSPDFASLVMEASVADRSIQRTG